MSRQVVLHLLCWIALPLLGAEADTPRPSPPAGAPPAGAPPAAASPIEAVDDDSLSQETAPTNPIEFLRSFREWVAQHRNPPPRARLDTALHDVWRAALRPRAGRMTRRIDKLIKRKYWLPPEGEPTHVKPEEWSRFVREIAGLMTELHGAWKQYTSARPILRRGIPVGKVRVPGHYYGYGHPALLWRRALVRRIAVGARHAPVRLGRHLPGANPGLGVLPPGGKRPVVGGVVHRRVGLHWGRKELYSYWNLLNRYRHGWTWRTHHCVPCEQHRAELQKAKADFIAERQRLFDTTPPMPCSSRCSRCRSWPAPCRPRPNTN